MLFKSTRRVANDPMAFLPSHTQQKKEYGLPVALPQAVTDSNDDARPVLKKEHGMRDGPKMKIFFTHSTDKIGYQHLVVYGVLRTLYVVTDGLNFGV